MFPMLLLTCRAIHIAVNCKHLCMLSPESHNQIALTAKKKKSTISIHLSWNYFFGIKINTGIIKRSTFDIFSFHREHFAYTY